MRLLSINKLLLRRGAVGIMTFMAILRPCIITSFQPVIMIRKNKYTQTLSIMRPRSKHTCIFSTLSQSDIAALENEIKQQGDLIRQLKATGVDKDTLAPHIETLMSLKARLPSKEESVSVTSTATTPPASTPTLKEKKTQQQDESQMSESEIRKTRLAKVQAMRDAGIQPFEYRYQPTHTAKQLQSIFEGRLDNGEEDVTLGDVSVAGRIMIKRIFGKLAFFTLQDETGTIQLQLEKNRLGDSFDVRSGSF